MCGENGIPGFRRTGDGNAVDAVLPDGAPLELILLCDTSASMDGEKRKQQAEFVATVLASLGEKDRFRFLCRRRVSLKDAYLR